MWLKLLCQRILFEVCSVCSLPNIHHIFKMHPYSSVYDRKLYMWVYFTSRGSLRASHIKALFAQRTAASPESEISSLKPDTKQSLSKPRPKPPNAKAEPPPKKRKKWKEEFTASPSSTSPPEAVSEDDGETIPGHTHFTFESRCPSLTSDVWFFCFRVYTSCAVCLPLSQHQDHEGEL